MSKYITQKEIAAILEVDRTTVRKNETRWGLVRVHGFARPRFLRGQTMTKLLQQGFLVS